MPGCVVAVGTSAAKVEVFGGSVANAGNVCADYFLSHGAAFTSGQLRPAILTDAGPGERASGSSGRLLGRSGEGRHVWPRRPSISGYRLSIFNGLWSRRVGVAAVRGALSPVIWPVGLRRTSAILRLGPISIMSIPTAMAGLLPLPRNSCLIA
jgi:hypothetical protein